MTEILQELTRGPLFGILLTILAYEIGLWISRLLQTPLANPLVLASALIIAFLVATGTPLEAYQDGGNTFTMLLPVATAVLAVSMYRNFEVLKANLMPVILGCLAGCVTAVFSTLVLANLFGLNEPLAASLAPKSVTTPIALELSQMLGGMSGVTGAAVIVAGQTGGIVMPLLLRALGITHPVATGVSMGTCAHVLGTTRAVELGEVEGAMSGISIGVAGLCTVFLVLFFL